MRFGADTRNLIWRTRWHQPGVTREDIEPDDLRQILGHEVICDNLRALTDGRRSPVAGQPLSPYLPSYTFPVRIQHDTPSGVEEIVVGEHLLFTPLHRFIIGEIESYGELIDDAERAGNGKLSEIYQRRLDRVMGEWRQLKPHVKQYRDAHSGEMRTLPYLFKSRVRLEAWIRSQNPNRTSLADNEQTRNTENLIMASRTMANREVLVIP
jgi:hypothetical protein